jgi:hypothetical protein
MLRKLLPSVSIKTIAACFVMHRVNVLNVIMLSVIMRNVFMLNRVMLSVVMLEV